MHRSNEYHIDVVELALTGRFLHVTDFHPDPHYKAGATFDTGCHRRPKEDNKGKHDGKKVHSGKGKGKALEVEDDDIDEDYEGDDDDDEFVKKRKSKRREEVAGRWGSGVS